MAAEATEQPASPVDPLSSSKKRKTQLDKIENKGFAYVDFDIEGSAVAAIALTETEFKGQKVLIKNAMSFKGRLQKEAAGPTTNRGATNNASTNGARYKKRYGKGALGRNRKPPQNGRRPERQEAGGGKDDLAPTKTSSAPEYSDSSVVSYKTGAVQKSEGKKITFD
ncbi:hypothetical protein NPX13_g8436 [Xylaria arbuscula]|uniref:RRM domain-containing protein n=1 Tax=Xylaria arbuscula TaxID=114810 RepID=A0A9W8N8N8_9PEZI|nr:hypothetical protein NPX13_g8436 [Xylaria arbuscula]